MTKSANLGEEATRPELRKLSGEFGATPAVAGVIGPVLFAALIIVAGSLRTGYSQFGGAGISELGVGPNSIIWNAGAISFGLLIITFAFGLHKGISRGKSSRVGPALVGVSGVGFVGLGLFPAAGVTFPFHQSFAMVVFTASILAPLFVMRRAGRNRDTKRYWHYSMATAIGAFVVLLTYFAGVQFQCGATCNAELSAIAQGIQVTPQGTLGAWAGLIQRIFFLVVWSWIEVTALLLILGRLKAR